MKGIIDILKEVVQTPCPSQNPASSLVKDLPKILHIFYPILNLTLFKMRKETKMYPPMIYRVFEWIWIYDIHRFMFESLFHYSNLKTFFFLQMFQKI